MMPTVPSVNGDTSLKPFWRSDCGRFTVYCADCLDVLPLVRRAVSVVVVTDPPYGVLKGGTSGTGGQHGLVRGEYISYSDSYGNFCRSIVPRLNAALDLAVRAAVFTGPHIHEQRKPESVGGVYCPAATGRNRWGYKRFLPVLLYGTYPNLNNGCSVPSAIMSNESAESNGHPCPKPIGWMEWLVSLASESCDMVLDMFMGSGTTGVACARLGRRFVGVEIERSYCELAVMRIKTELVRCGSIKVSAPEARRVI